MFPDSTTFEGILEDLTQMKDTIESFPYQNEPQRKDLLTAAEHVRLAIGWINKSQNPREFS